MLVCWGVSNSTTNCSHLMLRTEHAVAGEQQNQAYGIVLCAQRWSRDLTALETHSMVQPGFSPVSGITDGAYGT